jgi:hypothetical protein
LSAVSSFLSRRNEKDLVRRWVRVSNMGAVASG